MKSLLALIIIIIISTLPMVAVAGPEDHMSECCYTATTKTPGTVPAVFCLETAQLDGQYDYLMTSGTFSNVPSALKIKSYQHVTEDKVTFIAEANIVNIWNS